MASGTASATIEAMNVLVAYASKRGSTAEIAEAVAETIRSSGASVDCTDVAEVSSIEPYDAVVVGSAVYIKRWRRDARHFLRRHREQLAQRPLWVFSSGPVGEPKPELDDSWTEPRKTIEEAERLGAREHVVFGGRVPAEPRGPIERAMVDNTPPEYRDMRDWDAVRRWAHRIAGQLAGAP